MEQIKAGGPVTVTHEDIRRYFMTIPEAVQLVLRAAKIAKGGEIFVLDMGEPVKIIDLANNLIRLAGLVPEKDIKITYTGLRPGEKLYEELLITGDSEQTKTEIEKIFIEKSTYINAAHLLNTIHKLQTAAVNMDIETELMLLEDLVPTYKRTLCHSEHATCHSERSGESHSELTACHSEDAVRHSERGEESQLLGHSEPAARHSERSEESQLLRNSESAARHFERSEESRSEESHKKGSERTHEVLSVETA